MTPKQKLDSDLAMAHDYVADLIETGWLIPGVGSRVHVGDELHGDEPCCVLGWVEFVAGLYHPHVSPFTTVEGLLYPFYVAGTQQAISACSLAKANDAKDWPEVVRILRERAVVFQNRADRSPE